MWHDELHLHIPSRIPVALPRKPALRDRIVGIVDELRDANLPFGSPALKKREADLDDAIFDLYELNEADRDLVRDMCDYGLDFFYERSASRAVIPPDMPTRRCGLARDLPRKRAEGLTGYLQVFLRQWNDDLAPEGELAWEVIPGPGSAPVVAALFSTVAYRERPEPATAGGRGGRWDDVLRHISEASLVPAEQNRTIYTDTFVRAVSDHEILIIKRNEARFWTRSAALADADATVAQAMSLAERKP
jgi:hypothetical protein